MTGTIILIRIFRAAFYGTLAVISVAALIGVGIFFIAIQDLPRVPEPLSRIIETPPTEIFAATGERLMVMGGREVIPLSEVSTHFIQAILATEDHRFWEHHGVDKARTLKALWVTLFRPGRIEGASTITQQLSKNLFFSFKRSYMRKLRELLVAIQIESQYSKAEILEAYLNQVSMGVGANGVEQAARTFFGRPASELTLAQAALLAGLPKSPTRYNPYLHLDRAKKRQQVVLSRMEAVGYITHDQAQSSFQDELTLQPPSRAARTGSYFLDLVINGLEEQYGPEVVYHGGLKVTTTIDPQLQSIAEESLRGGLSGLDRMLGIDERVDRSLGSEAVCPQGALVAVETNSGAVKAMVGGRSYVETEYNRAIKSNRLPGSSFKPFLYYTAFEKLGLNPTTVYVDRPVSIPVKGAPDWEPNNFGLIYEGPMILKQALMKSVNSIAAQLVERTGPKDVIATAHRCGITSKLDPVYSVALGTSGVSPLEMASAFACFANGGIRHEPFWIWRVEDALGRVLEEHIISGEQALDESITYQLVDLMRSVVDAGTGSVIRRMGFTLPAAGKTGTTDGYYDAWFTGFTPTLCTSVWVGYDRGQGLRDTRGTGITGARAAAPIWADFMRKATEGDPPREFMIPSDIHFKMVDPITGMEATTYTPHPTRVALRQGQEIQEYTMGEEGLSNPEAGAMPSYGLEF
jgi:1A family penicillin-binding protein